MSPHDGSHMPGADGSAPSITFSSFVIGLATQALMFLGAAPDPTGNPTQRDPMEAAAIIGVIEMLATKTHGNLTEDEAKLVEEVLFELRMRYVQETRKSSSPGAGQNVAHDVDKNAQTTVKEEEKKA